jgi:G3E family GTPase
MTINKVPVTIITGFLGSGKTTLLNHILTSNHGKKIAVIENEFGEIGVDNELVINADEEIFEMNNGCICCSVRGDLIRILSKLMKRKDKFDYVIVETTGLADPSPVAQTFFVDDEIQENFKLDSIVTLVDAKHIKEHINRNTECKEQIAFSDVILLNKIDLIKEQELLLLKSLIKSNNKMAKIYETENSIIEIDKILNVGAFDLDSKLEIKPNFLSEEMPYEYYALFDFEKDIYELKVDKSPYSSIDILILEIDQKYIYDKDYLTKKAFINLTKEIKEINNNNSILNISEHNLFRINVSKIDILNISIDKKSSYAVFFQHLPSEFNIKILNNSKIIEPFFDEEIEASHEHDNEITSVGIEFEGALDYEKLYSWFSYILQEKGKDIFRMKGIININNNSKRFIFQGIHMLFDSKEDREWKIKEKRLNQVVFIGKNLNRQELNLGFKACLV